ncbi:chorismate mutase [Burkholderia singularis]|uniref:Chorismate mutase n=1 Tax=Burkholderia singularis TaxID=1503053 RepID=A0A238H3V4_9BURK|nr:chorismate mutase [Burkholderia singularis]SMF99996.1 Periplasmic chorismate mutase I precursor [Burkholderia singularis]
MKQSLRSSLAAAALSLAMMAAPRIAVADAGDTPLTNLVALVSQRLALAEPVAQWKWINKKPISDPPREATLLADVEKRAQRSGVDPAYARTFFEDQISASKAAQHALFANWRATQGPTGPAPDLATSTRPQLDRLTQSMLSALARVAPLRDAPDCPSRLARSVANWKALTRYDSNQKNAFDIALSHVCAAGSASAVG